MLKYWKYSLPPSSEFVSPRIYIRSPSNFGSRETDAVMSWITLIEEIRRVGGTEILIGLPFLSKPLKSLNIESFPEMNGVSYAVA